METALRRHANGAAVVIPVILRPVDWSSAPFAQLQALPRDGRPVTTWPNHDEAFAGIAQGIREVVRRKGHSPVGLQTRERVFDAAMPGKVVRGRTAELQTLIRLPDSPGLKGILQSDRDAEPRPEDVVSKEFPVTFPRNLIGEVEGFTARVTLSSPDFVPPTQSKGFIVPPEQDSEVVTFLLTPQRTGKLKLLVELEWEDAVRGTRRLLTECVADASAIAEPETVHLVQIPLAEGAASVLAERSAAAPAATAAPAPPPAPIPRAASNERRSQRRSPSRRGSTRAAWIGLSGTVAAALIAGVFSLMGNRSGPDSDIPPDRTHPVAPVVQSLVLSAPESVIALRPFSVTLSGKYPDGTSTTLTSGVSWKTSPDDLLTLADSGTGIAHKPGTALVTGSFGDISESTTIEILSAGFLDPEPGNSLNLKDGMHMCPAGTAITEVRGGRGNHKQFYCARLTTDSGAVTDAKPEMRRDVRGSHACPAGYYLRGMNIAENRFTCSSHPGIVLSSSESDITEKQYGMTLACASGEIAVGFNEVQEKLLCLSMKGS
jgi:hypothetical protein